MSNLSPKINIIKRKLITLHQNSPHIASSFSALEIIATLYYKVLKISDFKDKNRDRFVLSKGHSVSALYGVLDSLNLLEFDLDKYPENGGKLFSHPVRNYIDGIEVSSGSLGHGLSISIGLAYAAKIDKYDYSTYVLMGDGECQEGSVWEAAMIASRLNLGNLIALVDANGLQDSEEIDNISPSPMMKNKWEAFGWNVVTCEEVMIRSLDTIIDDNRKENKPTVIIIETTKGKGIKEIENKVSSHHYMVSEEDVDRLIMELES